MLHRLVVLRHRIMQRWRERHLAGPRVVRAFASAYPEAVFVEIGANDANQADHLRRFVKGGGWRGVLVEPNPAAFARLRARHGDDPRLALENAAISSADGRLPFYEIEPPADVEDYELFGSYDLLGSLSREALLSLSFVEDAERRIVETEVDALTLRSLFRKHGLDRVDLLLIDTEGHDFEIVKQVDLGDGRPRLIIYEHTLLEPADRLASRELLGAAGYELMEEFFDTFALDTTIDDPLTRKWRGLRPAVDPVYLRGR